MSGIVVLYNVLERSDSGQAGMTSKAVYSTLYETINALLRFKFLQPCTFHKLIQVLQRKDLPTCGQKHLFHVLTSDPESSARNAGNDFVFRFSRRLACHAQFAQMLNARNFISRRSVIFGDLRFDDPENGSWTQMNADFRR